MGMQVSTPSVTPAQLQAAVRQAAIRRRKDKDAGTTAMLGDVTKPGFFQQVISGKGVPLNMVSEAWNNRLSEEETKLMEAFLAVGDFGMRWNEQATVDEKLRGYGAHTGRVPRNLKARIEESRTVYRAREEDAKVQFEKLIKENSQVRYWMGEHKLGINDLLAPVLNPFEIDRGRGQRISPEVLNRTADLGYFKTAFPTKYGGLNLNHQKTDFLLRRLPIYGGGILGNIASNKSIGAKPLVAFGTEAQKDFFLPYMIQGDSGGRSIATFQLTEEASGTDAISGMQTTARISPDGKSLLINGGKIYSTNFYVAGLSHLAVNFIDENTKTKLPTVIEFMLPFRFNDTPEITKQKIDWLWDRGFEVPENAQEMLGIGGSTQGYSEAHDGQIPIEYAPGVSSILGGFDGIGRGDEYIFGGLYKGRGGFIALCQGLADLALNEALMEVVNEDRIRFKGPLSNMEYVKAQITDMAIKSEMLKAYSELTSAILDNNHEMNLIAETGIGKAMASELAWDVTQTANRLHGGKGLMKGQIIELMLRDAWVPLIVEGVNPALMQHGAGVSAGPAMVKSLSLRGKAEIAWNQIPSFERGDLGFGTAFGLQLSAKALSLPTMIKGAIHQMAMRDRQLDLLEIAHKEANIFARTAVHFKLKDLNMAPEKNRKEIAALEAFLRIASGKKLKNPTYVGQLYIDDAKVRYQTRKREDAELVRKYA